ncbi:Ku protein [Acidisoma cellulosilytica]|uniref:Non-homologous end joining protein Ku n=1 Tax=Acidisoma cellulosilyticum TaxID=2802395 RepID=A0A963Z6P3_9PROT|nr:Ku protein [Acidisoma cellulosilyticum]MCB8882848.1 Ku protein [Acidisoma cellulosilyticum]
MAKIAPRRKPTHREPPAAAGRPIWSGSLRLALVTVQVQLFSAIKTGARLSFHQIDQKSGKRIRYEKVAPGVGAVDAKRIAKGYEVSKGQYVLLTDEELDSVKIEARRTIDLVQFVDHCEIDPIYFDRPYYVLPDGDLAEEGYTVLRDALRHSGKMGLGQFVMRGREYVAALKPCGDGLMLETLRFADEVRSAAPLFADIGDEKTDPELLDLAQELIKRKSGQFNIDTFHDHYTESLRDLIESKAKTGKPISVEENEPDQGGSNVIDLVGALKRSLAEKTAAKAAPANDPAPKPKTKPVRKTAPARRRAS